MGMMTPAQKWLADYLLALGASLVERAYIVSILWEPEALEEILLYILETREKDLAQLSEVACKISRKYRQCEVEYHFD